MHIHLEIYSPVNELQHHLFDEKGLKVFIKRDDMIHPFISGNKWRKLKYILNEAQAQGKHHLVTFGGAYSNHLLATAAAGAKFGFKTTGIVRGEEVTNDTLFLCRLHGMNLQFIDRETYRNKQKLFDSYYGDDKNAFFIDEGGASAEGAKGCSELVDELTETYDHLICACGTGTTGAGIINGLARHKLPTTFHAVPVLKNGAFMREQIGSYLPEPTPFLLHEDYHFGGYAKTDQRLISFIADFTAATGILIEPVYTGKMLYALFDLARQDQFKPGSRILAIHTGGLLGIFGQKDKFI